MDRPASSAVAVAGGVEVFVPLGADVDMEKLKEVLANRARKVGEAIEAVKGKLGNEQFRSRAPPDVVAAEEERLADAKTRLAGLQRAVAEVE